MVSWSDNDYRALVQAAEQVRARPHDLLLVLYAESGLNPAAIAYVKGEPYARGLNQITPPNAKAMGLSDEEWESISSMSPAQNLPLVVRSLRAAVGNVRYADAGQLYQVNFAPASLSKGSKDGLVLYTAPSGGYMANSPLDYRKKGTITVGDLRYRLAKVAQDGGYKLHAARLRNLYPELDGPVLGEDEGLSMWWAVAGGVVIASGLYAWQAGYFDNPSLTWEGLKQKVKALT